MKKRNIKRLIKGKKKSILGGIIVAIILMGIIVGLMKDTGNVDSFEEGFKYVEKLDHKYDTSFKSEQLNWSLINRESIDPFIADLESFKVTLDEQEQTQDVRAVQTFVHARTLMLQSQKNWILGEDIGLIGEVHDEEGFRCSEFQYIINAALYYNASWILGLEAMTTLDILLSEYKDVEGVKKLVGIDDTKAAFFKSPFYQAGNHFRRKILALELKCGFDFKLTDKELGIIDV